MSSPAYQVFARRYRPKCFEAVVGQDHVVRALMYALEMQRLHHAYLFTGTRGVGKTTLSRILAKSFNCIGSDGTGSVTANPCGVCDICMAIDEGRCIDYIEMDAASHRGVEEMASVLEQAVYAPSRARFKVYMIDEVHMLTHHAFNAMLKTLEEPPPHVKFILATTDPQKISATVLSRCLQFNLRPMSPAQITRQLTVILKQENIVFALPALHLLAKSAQGSMRDALSLTDQAVCCAGGQVTTEAVQAMLGILDTSYICRILDALANDDGNQLCLIADEMAACGVAYDMVLQDLSAWLHQIALVQIVPIALPEDLLEREDILRLAKCFKAEEIQLYYQIVVHGRNELPLAPDEYAGFMMTLLRMLAFRPQGTQGIASAPPLEQPFVQVSEDKIKEDKRVFTICGTQQGAFDWPTLSATLPLKGIARELAQQSEVISLEDSTHTLQLHLRIPTDALATPAALDKLTAALSQQLGRPVMIRTMEGTVMQTAHLKQHKERAEQQHHTHNQIRHDPFVQAIVHEFDATIAFQKTQENPHA